MPNDSFSSRAFPDYDYKTPKRYFINVVIRREMSAVSFFLHHVDISARKDLTWPVIRNKISDFAG